MNVVNALLVVMTVLVSAGAFAILCGEYLPTLRNLRSKAPPLTHTRDRSLSRQSINWLAATALIAALLICVVLM